MCGIVGAVSRQEVANTMVECLHRLEYRGYDSAGLAVVDQSNHIHALKVKGKVDLLRSALAEAPLHGRIGIAHTRWATHGEPSEKNAHPHFSNNQLAIVHNGIIENQSELHKKCVARGYKFQSDTDSEVIAHILHYEIDKERDIIKAIKNVVSQLTGAYAFAVVTQQAPESIYAVAQGCPLVVGLGAEANYIASDQLALLPLTHRFIYLEEGDFVEITEQRVQLFNPNGEPILRSVAMLEMSQKEIDKGDFRHYMQKEIYEQPGVIQSTLLGRIDQEKLADDILGPKSDKILKEANHIHIIACGTSFHAGMVARYWIEALTGISCNVEIASEYRYREFKVPEKTIFLCISQSGETADTLAALRKAKSLNYLATFAICNVETSSLVRECDHTLLTHAGPEIGVASTKAFTTQLVALMLTTLAIGRQHHLTQQTESNIISHLNELPHQANKILELDERVKNIVHHFVDKQHMLFLGRGLYYPVAKEAALKVKELSYIHAEAYPAGELKHGPLALVDKDMPVIAIADNDALLEKLSSNLKEVRARGGELYVFSNTTNEMGEPGTTVIQVPAQAGILSPILYTIPLQLFAYHVAVLKGTDIDQPRNLAKSVTVE